MTTDDPARAKATLRQRVRMARDQLAPDYRQAAATAIADAIDREVFAALAPGAIVALYAAIRSEVDSAPIAARASARGLTLAYPRIEADRELAFAIVDREALTPGAMGIPAPVASAPAIDPGAIDIFVIPAIAFDPSGARLGWGGGYYDRILARAPHARRVGVAFASQLVASVPTDGHDQRVHLIVTEVALHRCA
ncbi:MAG: 5-formyltetrahydrofolate cyclo-ligase [Deltaproteobacteria bacterium]|nr:5-formyltetrahydrofolate cyclo-ligase [Deltaproteobacteria bacterium]